MESVDLNLLRTFVLLCKLNSLKRAGLKLGISESAVSKQMTKLREQLGHPLFERTTEGLRPTHYSRAILPNIEQALSMVHSAISPVEFNPATYAGPITLAFFAYTLEFSGVKLFRKLSEKFPKAQIELKTWTSDTEQKLEEGDITLGVHFLNEDRSTNIFQKRITADQLVIAVSKSLGRLTWEEALQLPFIKISSQGWNKERYRYLEMLKNNGIEPHISITVDNFSVARQILEQGEHACVLSDSWKDASLNTIEPPKELSIDLNLVSCMRLVDRQSPLNLAVHDVVKRVMLQSR
ncbi:LysR family transcriptional regulator [Vibrio sp. VB16]|uniref:LysR family transcriptional regulator n=1 Tax=Vibrio sp. VB16 TaxID=2785746 RepID=UPI00189C93B6|nr:LysR family transcriptional regulator [Vibrio sp. VB16]UGA53599.1 LysR family transcriptional regulator [Vibrio sp. VB16]